MAARTYDFALHRDNRRVDKVAVFTRAADLDDEKYTNDTDGLLLKWLQAAMVRAGAKPDELAAYELHVTEHGKNRVVRVFAAHPDEVKP